MAGTSRHDRQADRVGRYKDTGMNDLTKNQEALIKGMQECVALYNDLRERITESGLQVDTSAYSNGRVEVTIYRDIREVEINLK